MRATCSASAPPAAEGGALRRPTRVDVTGGRHVVSVSNGKPEPPTSVTYDLEEVLDLLAALEEARDTLRDTEHLTGVVALEAQIQLLSRRLGFDDGGSDAR
jgi:hypothetical protein